MLDVADPACATATVRVMLPPVRVTVPLRLAVLELAVALTETLPLFVPLVGEAVIQLWLSLTVQLTFAVTATGCEEAAAPSDNDVGETLRLLVPPPPQVPSTSVASRRPLPDPAAFSAMHFETSAG